MKGTKTTKASRGPRKMGVTKTVQPPLTIASPAAPAKYGQTASVISPTRGVGSSYKSGKSGKRAGKKHY